jgi:WD40 repeat protein
VGFSPDGRWIIELPGSKINGKADDCLRMFNAFNGKQIWQTIDSAISSVSFGPDSSLFGIADLDGLVQVLRTATGSEVYRLLDERSIRGRVWHIEFSPDGQRIATVDNSQVQIFDTSTGKEIAHVNQNSRVRWLTFNTDSQWVAIASDDNMVRVFEAATANEVSRVHLQAFAAKLALWQIS